MGKNRNSKKFRKKLNKRNQMKNQHINHNMTDWFNRMVYKTFDMKKYSELQKSEKNKFDITDTDEKLKEYERVNKVGNELLENIVKNKNVIRRLLKFMIKNQRNIGFEQFTNFFQKLIYSPYNLVGNKHNKYFDEFYDFISEFSISDIVKSDTNDGEEIVLFRMMDENEYLNLLVGNGIESPSYTTQPYYLQFMRTTNTLMNVDVKSIFVMCKFNTNDIIHHFGMGREGEVIMKKGSKPTFIKKFNEYGVEELKGDFCEDVVNYLPLSHSQLNNGFTYMDGLVQNGYKKILDEYVNDNGQYYRIGGGVDRWCETYQNSIYDVIRDLDVDDYDSNPHITQQLENSTILHKLYNGGGEETFTEKEKEIFNDESRFRIIKSMDELGVTQKVQLNN